MVIVIVLSFINQHEETRHAYCHPHRRQKAHPAPACTEKTNGTSHANDPHKIAAYLDEVFHAENEHPFQVGDLITFRKADGTVGSVMILEMRGNEVQAIFYDGMPHRFQCSVDDLSALRIVRIEELNAETVAMYRDLVGLVMEPAYTN